MEDSNDKKAIIYCRAANVFQIQETDALHEREQLCRDYADQHDYNVAEVFIDQGVSGSLENQGIQTMLDFLKASHEEIIVIVASIDQLAQNFIEYKKIRNAIQAAGGKLESPSFTFDDTPESNLMENVLLARAELEERLEQQEEASAP